jgi:hypothetical protein
MKLLDWLRAAWRRRHAALEPRSSAWPASQPSRIDIVLSEIAPDELDAQQRGEATDYDVRSLGEPIDPAPRDATSPRRRA